MNIGKKLNLRLTFQFWLRSQIERDLTIFGDKNKYLT